MDRTIIGVFDSEHEVQPLIQHLSEIGIDRSRIDVVDNQRSFDSDETSTDHKSSGFRRWLQDFGLTGKDPDYMAESVRRGSVLVTVKTDDAQVDRVSDLLCQHGAVDIDKRAEYYRSSGFNEYDDSAPMYSRDEAIAERERFSPGGQFAIPVIEENVSIDKRRIDRGRVRVVSHVTERPVEESVTLRDEHVDVERRSADRPLNSSDLDAFKEGEMEFRESTEEVVVNKEARVVEEVLVRQESDERTETVHETARRRDVEIERDAGKTDRPLNR